jgi:hypothetical protein
MFCSLAACLLAALPTPDMTTAIRQACEARCLLVVSINPESRVKAERGTAAAQLRRGATTLLVVKVLNDGGVTAPLRVSGPGIDAGGWLDAGFAGKTRLSGGPVDYLFLRLTPREAGRREATFRFDVGQGTQDLGFRAEVPVLFRVQAD